MHSFSVQKAARSRWGLLWQAAVVTVHDMRRYPSMTVACRRALYSHIRLLTETTVVKCAQSSKLVRLCFCCWRVAMVSLRAESGTISDLDAVSAAERQLRVL